MPTTHSRPEEPERISLTLWRDWIGRVTWAVSTGTTVLSECVLRRVRVSNQHFIAGPHHANVGLIQQVATSHSKRRVC